MNITHCHWVITLSSPTVTDLFIFWGGEEWFANHYFLLYRDTSQRHNAEQMSLDWISLFSLVANSGKENNSIINVILCPVTIRQVAHLVPTLTQIVTKWEREPFKVGSKSNLPAIIKIHYFYVMISSGLKRWFS